MNEPNASSGGGRVLIVTATVGAGHNSVARAIVTHLQTVAPHIDLECVDVLTFTPWAFRAYYAGGFALAMTRFGRIYGLGFRITNRPHRPERGLMERRRLWCERIAMRRFARRLRARPPDLIVNTPFLAAPFIGRLIRDGDLDVRQFVAVTDIEVHRFWYSENVDRWFVPADHSAAPFRKWGIDPGRITVSGIPIHPKWTDPLDRERILRDWSLPRDRRIVLLSGGTEFTCGPIVKIARRIAGQCEGAYVVVLAGRNKKLLGQLSALPEVPERLVGVGFTDRIHELVEVCSLMVTKAGGVTTAECLAKGTPMVLLKPVPGHEAGNAEYLAGEGAAVITRSIKEVVAAVVALLGDEGELEGLERNARRLYRPAGRIIADAVCEAVQRPQGGSQGPRAGGRS